jgi:hypothetical protein
MKKENLDCDWCKNFFALSSLFNVSYLDEDGNENGWGNVLCEKCVEEAIEIHGSRGVDAWQ